MEKMTPEKAGACFAGGIDCSQVVFGHAAEQIGMDKDEARRIAAAFGGGMWHGETCGCIAGALMAIGYKYGHAQEGDQETKNVMLQKKAAFEEAFTAKRGSLICRELLGYDLSKPEELEKIMEENLLTTLCPLLATEACGILDELLAEK